MNNVILFWTVRLCFDICKQISWTWRAKSRTACILLPCRTWWRGCLGEVNKVRVYFAFILQHSRLFKDQKESLSGWFDMCTYCISRLKDLNNQAHRTLVLCLENYPVTFSQDHISVFSESECSPVVSYINFQTDYIWVVIAQTDIQQNPVF